MRLVNAFRGHVSKFEQKNTSEWVSRNVLGFGGIIRVILNKYRILHEFNLESPDSRSKFRAYVKKVTREFHFARDCKAFENTKQGGTFKTVLVPILKQTLPYSGIAMN